MNKVILMGRLTRDPDIRYSQAAEPLAIARYTLAVDRRFQRRDNSGNEQTADLETSRQQISSPVWLLVNSASSRRSI